MRSRSGQRGKTAPAAAFLCAVLLLTGSSVSVRAAVATDDERAVQTAVGSEEMLPVAADDLEPGEWPIEVDSSSSMFSIVSAVLCVPEDATEGLTADITLSGTGYIRLFMGTGEEAVAADASRYSEYTENADGAYSFQVPVASLNTVLECTGFSRRKEKWYDHQVCFLAETLPVEALRVAPHRRQTVDLADGRYRMNVTLEGGSGKASLESPAEVEIRDGLGTATLVWSSPNYDYMIVNDREAPCLPVNTDGNSVFEVPVYTWDAPQPVVADTTAMSTPHEIVYRITFDTASADRSGGASAAAAIGVALVAAVLAAFIGILRKVRGSRGD